MKARDTVLRLWGYTIRFRAPGTDAWEKYLLDLANRARDLRPVFERFGPYMLQSIERNFQAQGRPSRWAALSPLYAERKAERWPGKGILEASGTMRQGFAFEATPQTLKIANLARWWWIVHQKGSENLFGRGIHLPQRIMLYLQDVDKGVFTRWVRQFVKTGGL